MPFPAAPRAKEAPRAGGAARGTSSTTRASREEKTENGPAGLAPVSNAQSKQSVRFAYLHVVLRFTAVLGNAANSHGSTITHVKKYDWFFVFLKML